MKIEDGIILYARFYGSSFQHEYILAMHTNICIFEQLEGRRHIIMIS